MTVINTTNGKIRWQNKTAEPLVGDALATAGNSMFNYKSGDEILLFSLSD